MAIQILHVLVGNSLQPMFKVFFFFSLEMFVALGDLDLYGCQDFLPKKRQFRRFTRRKFGYAYNFGLDVALVVFLNKPINLSFCYITFLLLGLRKKERKKSSCTAYKILSFFLSFLLRPILSLI